MASDSQKEELEVLQSIYDGDANFRELEPTKFQYKYGEDGNAHSFLLDISWPAEYPDCLPTLGLDAFYNKHLKPAVKEEILSKLTVEAEANLGMGSTYTIIEYVKENLEELLTNQPTTADVSEDLSHLDLADKGYTQKEVKEAKAAVLTKAQKRKQWNNMDGKTGEKARGYDWVDVIKHLSQTGGAQPV